MGLDTVELVMAFEETFEITIPDDAAEQIVTVRDAIDYIYSRVQHSDSQVCRTQRAFYRLRRTLQNELGVERTSVKPATAWETLIPLARRRALWKQLDTSIGASKWPELTRSRWAVGLIAALSIGSAATAYAMVPAYNLVAAALVALLSVWLALCATENWRVHFAHDRATVGQTAELLALGLPTAWQAGAGWTRAQVRLTVRQIVTDRLNVDPNFDDGASFVDDLGAD